MPPEIQKFRPKRDRYAKSRGGNSQFYNIYCACGAHIALYQKDGPGALLRMYLDRIFAPPLLVAQNDGKDEKSLPAIKCTKCKKVIAVPMVYKLENRLAFRMMRGASTKKKSDGTFPPPSS